MKNWSEICSLCILEKYFFSYSEVGCCCHYFLCNCSGIAAGWRVQLRHCAAALLINAGLSSDSISMSLIKVLASDRLGASVRAVQWWLQNFLPGASRCSCHCLCAISTVQILFITADFSPVPVNIGNGVGIGERVSGTEVQFLRDFEKAPARWACFFLWLLMPVSPPVFTLTFVKTDSSSGEQGPAELEAEKTWINKHVPQISENICSFYFVLRMHTT